MSETDASEKAKNVLKRLRRTNFYVKYIEICHNYFDFDGSEMLSLYWGSCSVEGAEFRDLENEGKVISIGTGRHHLEMSILLSI